MCASVNNELTTSYKQNIKKRRIKLLIVLLTIVLCNHLMTIPILFLYQPENIELVPRLLTPLYKTILLEQDGSNLYINRNAVLSYLKYNKLAELIIYIFIQSSFLFIPFVFYKKEILKSNISKIISIKIIDIREKLLITFILFSMILYIIISSVFTTPQYFPPLNLMYIIFWMRYILIICFFSPFCEELLFRGIILDELRYCYRFSNLLIILFQALVFFLFHFLFSNSNPLIIFLLGIVMGTLTFYTNSLFYNLLYHICYNLFILLTQTGFINIAKYEISLSFLAYLIILLFILNILSLIIFTKYMKKKNILSPYQMSI
jgi:membrane protease YdiL (CAAX protease family)